MAGGIATQHVLFFKEALGIEQSADGRTVVEESISPLAHETTGSTQSAHVACEHIEQQVDLKVASVVSATGDSRLWRSKNMCVSLPTLHLTLPVRTSVAEQSVPVQQRSLEHVAALPGQYVEPALLTFVKPEHGWSAHVAFATQHVLFFDAAVGNVQSADARAVVAEGIFPLTHVTRGRIQSAHVACEHDEQQVARKASSVLPT